MPNIVKDNFIEELKIRFGSIQRISNSLSLFDISNGKASIYIRYSKKHNRNQTFYGLRDIDLKLLEGKPSIICFLWENQKEPLLIPYSEYEEVFRAIDPASDGQYKVQVYESEGITELYIANAGRFNVESYYGWDSITEHVISTEVKIPILSHNQVQSLIGSIGINKGYNIWLPLNDRKKMDWSLVEKFNFHNQLPHELTTIKGVVEEIDVIWLDQSGSAAKAFFEVEHTTPIYSALLRFNDVHLLAPNLKARFSIVSNNERRSLFVRQLNRPTFQMSNLCKECNFLEYRNVYLWHKRILKEV